MKKSLEKIARAAERACGRKPGTIATETVQEVIDKTAPESHPVTQAILGALGREGR